MSSGGSNLAADSPDLLALVEQRRAQIAADDGVDPSDVPPDAVTASGSGLDPDISPAYAAIQVQPGRRRPRICRPSRCATWSRRTSQAVRSGFIGEERVNVLELNLALQQLAPDRRPTARLIRWPHLPHPAARSARRTRGRLRVYLGAAPGVGKTVDMLCEGRRRAGRGTDVVIGVYETHGREFTAEQVGDLPVVPRRVFDAPRRRS